MSFMSSRRPAAGALRAVALACVLALAGAATAGAATTVYPAGGSDFATGLQGWSSAEATCAQTSGLVLCSTTNAYDGSVGNPAGSLDTRVDVTANVLGTFDGLGTWQSPAFTPADEGEVTEVEFAYDRRFDHGGLIALEPSSRIAVSLIDLTAPSASTVLTETLTPASSAFATDTATLPTSAIVAGHSYRLRVRSITSSSGLGLLGQLDTRFDNVRLSVTTS